ncbi:hypothetical protein L3Q82_010533, partial [Scortum barcoo]
MPTTLSASEREMSGRPPSTPHLGHFEYQVMPFGLTNAPAVFQAMINDVLRDMLNRFIFVLALQEWRHWLEGAEQPFLVWTDHKNLAYLRSAKRLNPPSPSPLGPVPEQFSLDTSPSEPASILPPSCIVGAASWDIETRVQEALKDHPAPNNCPKDRLFVPSNLRSLLCSSGSTPLNSACHPGIRRTLFLLQQRFWWPRMAQDTQEYINACSVCARGKSSHRAPAGFLKPLPIPHRPWSHIAVDFVSGLPPSIPRRRTRLFPPSKPTSADAAESGAPLEPLWFVPPLAARSRPTNYAAQRRTIYRVKRCGSPPVTFPCRFLPASKLAPRYIGPYVVEKVINPSSVRLSSCLLLYGSTLPSTSPSSSHSLLVSFARPPTPLLPPSSSMDTQHTSVKEVLDVRRRGRGYQYLVDWEGYGPEERSWISRKLILDNVLLRDFYSKHPDKPGRPPEGASVRGG